MISNGRQERLVAQLVVRGVEDRVKQRLKRRAALHGRSMEEEIRCILREAVKAPGHPASALGTRIAARFRGLGLQQDLPELGRQPVRPADFER